MLPLFAMAALPPQIDVPRIAMLPDVPTPFAMRDWKRVARAYDKLVFDERATGRYLPLVWRIPSRGTFGIPSYVGAEKMRGQLGEGLTCLGSVLGGTMVGIDKTPWLPQLEPYFSPEDGIVLNNVGGRSGDSFWYDILPSVYFAQISSHYPSWKRGREISKTTADAWIRGVDALGGDFDHTAFDLRAMKPVDNGKWKEPEAAAGIAYLELMAAVRSGDRRYLEAARKALDAMQKRRQNPTYEALVPYGAVAAAYLNAKEGDHWDLARFIDWSLEPTSPYREGWGMVVGRWGEYDVGGLLGSTTDAGGYAFAMNTYLAAAALAPIARYEPRYSKAIAKWILNLANASRLFYRNGLPARSQSSHEWDSDPDACLAYEGLRYEEAGARPRATGDAKKVGWSGTDFGLYGGGTVGLLAALVDTTDVPGILRIDLRATDFLSSGGDRVELIWNPYRSPKTIALDLGPKPVRLRDRIVGRDISARPVKGRFRLLLSPSQIVQIEWRTGSMAAR